MFQSSIDMDKKIEKQQQVYKRVKLLGTGAYGKAYLVKEIKTDENYVIKQILMADMSQQQQQNALRQAKILQALSHPNIIKFKQVYRTSKMRLNIVMEYADEGDLASKIKQAKKEAQYFEQTQILDWFTQICLGIKHIHDRKIIHRDLKAQNIFLTSDKIIKIGDFGVSRVLERTVMNARTVVGSPYYLSPQIIQNKPYSFQTDIWSLGALLYEMCALSPPFVANNLQFLALKIVKGAYGQIPSQYSYDLKSLIKSMLNTDSSKRPNINKILTSKVISKRISTFLTESKRMDQFSHTVIHNKNIFEANPPKNQQNEGKALKPPPNLINIQKDLQNKSEIVLSNVNFELESSPKSRPFTPLMGGQQRKGPNNFFNNKNKKPINKIIPQAIQKAPSHHNLNDLIQIKPSALQQKVKLPKVHTNPTIFDRRQSQVFIKKKNSGLEKLQEKQIPTSAFTKKRTQSKEMFANVVETKKEMEREEEKGEDLVGVVGKWKKTPKLLGKIETPPQIYDNNIKDPQEKIFYKQIPLLKQQATQQALIKKQQPQSKAAIKKTSHRSSSKKQAPNVPKKNINKKQIKQVKQNSKKTPQIDKKTSRKQLQEISPTFEVVSQEMKKKAAEERMKRRSTSKRKGEGERKHGGQKKVEETRDFTTVSNIKKPPSDSKIGKKPISIGKKPISAIKKPEYKLAQPPRLLFENTQQFESPQKLHPQSKQGQQQTIHQLEYQNCLIQEQKCNSDRSDDQQMEEMYLNEDFQRDDEVKSELRQNQQIKEQQDNDLESDKDLESDSEDQAQQRMSLNLSESCKPSENYNKMLKEMENIKNAIAMARGVIDTLPVFGQDSSQYRNLLELSQPTQEIIREDDSEMESIVNQQEEPIDHIDQTQPSISYHEPHQTSSTYSNSPSQTTTNLTLFSNQQHLQTLKMNLQQLFGQKTIIFIHQFLCEIVQKQGLDFNQKDIQRMILFQNPEISPVLLRKYFRLIVTVVIMERQENTIE